MSASRRVVFVLFEGFQSLDLTGPWEVFDGAATHRSGAPSGSRPARPYELTTASLTGAPLHTSGGLALTPDAALGSITDLHTLVVVGGAGTVAAHADGALIAEVGRLAGLAERVTSVCTGAFLLARAGLLEGRRAATHWAHAGKLA